MIEFNLLPDVKLEYIQAERSRRLLITISLLIAVVSIGIFGVTLGVNQLQKKHSNALSRDIASDSAKLSGKKQLNKVLTVQNQLLSLTALHDAKPDMTRLFGYLDQVTPAAVSIATVHLDNTSKTLLITGEADAISTVNKYIDTLKFTTYKVKGSDTEAKPFSNIVLGGFSYAGKDKKSTYSISLVFDEAIFNVTKDVTLTVPNLVTTRSELEKPADLFSAADTSAATGSAKTNTTGQGN